MAQPFESSQSRSKPQAGENSRGRLHPQQERSQNPQTPSPSRPGDAGSSSGSAHAVSSSSSTGEGEPGSCDQDHSNDANAGFTRRTPSGCDDNLPSTAAHVGDSTEGGLRNGSDEPRGNDASPPPISPISPAMSNTQPPPGHPRQPMSYPSPTAFAPSGMSYAYPPAPGPHPEAYRVGASVNNTMTLPNIRTFDHLQPPPPPPQYGMPMVGHMPPGGAPPPGYPAIHPAYPGHPADAMRFALPPGLAVDHRIALSGGRHKKEIKRRTKTGCLTCRKRRIKCDEGHPTCHNCKKSKRECLGYDPIFKQQQGPASIPAAANNSKSSGASPTFTPAPSTPSTTAHPDTSSPAISVSYPASSQPDNVTSYDPSAPPPEVIKPEPGFDYSSAPIDPALEVSANPPPSLGAPVAPQGQIHSEEGSDHRPAPSNQARGGAPIFLNTLHALCRLQIYYKPREIPLTHASFPAKKMKVDELIALGGPPPPPSSSSPSPETIDEIVKLYHEVYAPGLGFFLETQWYGFKNETAGAVDPPSALRSNQPVLNLFASFLRTVSAITGTDPTDMVAAGHAESLVVWSLMILPKSSTPPPNPVPRLPEQLPPVDDHAELLNRLLVFEALITGETLPANPLTPPPPNIGHHQTPQQSNVNINSTDLRRIGEFDFWHLLGQYLLQSYASASGMSAREQTLARMRNLLDGRENRDVLYSIAILREYTRQFDALMTEQTAPQHLEESDARSKLAVATRFIRDESAATGGTTNVVRRIADIAYRAFVKPGVNVGERPGSD